MASERNPMRQRLVDYLEGFGLDAGEISADGWDEFGFYLIRPGADDDRRHPWPDGFDVDWLRSLAFAADAEDRRLGFKYDVVG